MRLTLLISPVLWVRRKIQLLFSIAILSGIGIGVGTALHSGLFTLESVSVLDADQVPAIYSVDPIAEHHSPYNQNLTSTAIRKIADAPVGKVSLFDLDLKPIETRLLENEWISSVQLEKRLPKTLVIKVSYRKARALTDTKQGSLAYLDENGLQFGAVDLLNAPDLPLIAGVSENSEKRQDALHFINEWETVSLNRVALISSLYWDAKKGFQALVAYPMKQKTVTAMIELGQEIDSHLDMRFFQLLKVFQYLSKNSVISHQIRADVGKKVVVKTSQGS